MTLRRVVVTGLGLVTALGTDVRTVWRRLCEGDSGVSPIERFDSSEYPTRFAGEVRDFDLHRHMEIDRRDARRMDRFCQFSMLAARHAVDQSGLEFDRLDPYRCGVIVGSGIGGLDEIESQHTRLFDLGPGRVSALMIPKLMINAASGNISIHWGIRGPNLAVATACASGNNAIGEAWRMIRTGVCDVMISGGTEAPLTPMGICGFGRMQALSTRNEAPSAASRPFDRDRDGFVLAEGAGMLVLEEMEFAKARGADILAEVRGFGLSADAIHMTAPVSDGAGAARSMENALRHGGLNPEDVDYINAHGTSTPLGDPAECAAIRNAFGPEADRIAVSSTKSQLGHLLGASGGVESVVCVQSIRTNTVPPTINLENPDPNCALNHVRLEARELEVRAAVNNSFGFGGHNASLVFSRV